jgi:UDP-N-acetylmuramate dehydrogenase
MKIQENILLKDFTTFQIGGKARYFAVTKTEEDLREAFAFAKSRKLPIFVLGGGSNLLVSDNGFSGLVIKNEIKGIKFIDKSDDQVILEIGAGEVLDEAVALSIIRNLSGLENLSGIPGTIGGAVVQNAGAYGVEIKDCLLSAAGFNSANGKEFILDNKECQYGYRDSFFKKNKKYIITSVTLKLSKKSSLKIDYAGLKDILGDKKEITSSDVREVILKIRTEKLPDWHKVGTAGSFFKNPVISADKYTDLKSKFGEIPGFPEPKGQVKVPLAWILDKICNLKGYKEERVGLYEKQPIILVNFGGATQKDILNFSEKIKIIIKEKTGIEINNEVENIK